MDRNAEWDRNNLISSFWECDLLRWRLADEMLVVEDLSLNNDVVVFSSKFASGLIFQLVLKTFAGDNDIGVLRDRT